jgi:peroxiredoxin
MMKDGGKGMSRIVLIALVLSVALFSGCSRENAEDANKKKALSAEAVEGGAAPDFTLKDLAGHDLKLSDLKGKVVLLNFWATWCPPCREEVPSLVSLNKQMSGKSFQMVTVSIDEGGKQAVEEFFKASGVTLPVLLDTERNVSSLYGTTGVPETFVIDRNGVIVKKVVGGMNWSDAAVVKSLDNLIVR